MPTSNDSQTELELRRVLAGTFVKQVRYHETLESTNTTALRYCQRDDLKTPLLVIAAQQTSGRGRGSNGWWSDQGSLTFSLVVRNTDVGLVERKWPQASLTAGLSVCFAIQELLPHADVSLKWPNDVQVNRRKVCGVLVEIGPTSCPMLVIGIGVNVNNSVRNAPNDLRAIATSLVDVSGNTISRNLVLVGIVRQLEIQLARLSCDDPGLAADWQNNCALLSRTVEIDTGTHRIAGECQGIDEEGALLLRTADGPTRFFSGILSQIE